MKLRIGQPVNTTDGPFGELGDIVIDPNVKSVTHLVVEPHQEHYQARLVSVSLVSEDDDVLTVDLDTAHMRRLERVAFSDYVSFDETIDLGPDWDIGTEDIVAAPYIGYQFDMGWYDDRVGIRYDRIPKGECEIRRSSEVVTSDDHVVGHVDGLVSDDDHLTAVVVRVGLPGFRHDVLAPLGAVSKVRNDRIQLSIDRHQFDLLPSSEIFGDADELTSHIAELQQRAEAIAAKVADRGRTLVADAKSRLGSGRSPR